MNNCESKFPRIILSDLLLLHKAHDVNKFISDCVVFLETDDLVKVAIYDDNDISLIDFLYNFFRDKNLEIFLTSKQEIDFFNFKSYI